MVEGLGLSVECLRGWAQGPGVGVWSVGVGPVTWDKTGAERGREGVCVCVRERDRESEREREREKARGRGG